MVTNDDAIARSVASLRNFGHEGYEAFGGIGINGKNSEVHAAMGLCLLDYLQFEDLVPVCEETGHWSFLCVIAPLRLAGGAVDNASLKTALEAVPGALIGLTASWFIGRRREDPHLSRSR